MALFKQCVMYAVKGGQMGYGRSIEKPRATGGEVCYISQGSRRLFTDIGLGLTER
jgi:hypothetical protein